MFKLPAQIKDGIPDYGRAIREFMEGKIAWARLSGIRVPWGNYSHRGGEVFMSRVRVPAGFLTPLQLKALAYCSKHYGNGALHLTTRQDIQIHEVKIENIIKIHEYLKDYELSSRAGGGNTVRNITACPLAGICPKEAFDVREDAIPLTEYLLSAQESYNLPRKFKISFSGCVLDCAGSLVNDVGLFAREEDSRLGYRVYVGGGMGASSDVGKPLEKFIAREDLGYVLTAIRNVFYKHGDRKNKHHNRLRFLILDMGLEAFKGHYRNELRILKENEHIFLRKCEFYHPDVRAGGVCDNMDEEDFREFLKYNYYEQKQNGMALIKLRIPQGDLTSDKAEALAGLEDEFQGMEFRLSQEQDLYAANIPEKDLYRFYSRIKNILSDFLFPSTLLDVVVCKGSLTCNLGLCNSPALARELEKTVKKNFRGTDVFEKINIKINGCPNACGQHPLGIISLCGAVRKVFGRPVPFYRLFLGGRAGGEENTHLAEDTGILIPARNAPLFLSALLAKINKDIAGGTDIYEYVLTEAQKTARDISGEYAYVPDYSENRDFYIDWGRQEEFSLDGLGPGECGAGILDMIESDLSEAKIALDDSERQGYSPEGIRKGLSLSLRALLVTRGHDPKTEEEAFSCFKEYFVDQAIVSGSYAGVKEFFDSTQDNLGPEERRRRLNYAKGFLGHINQVYKSMDSAFNFPRRNSDTGAGKEKEGKVLDLKGTPCPINYVKAKIFLENLKAGDTVEIMLDEGEPINNVPKSLQGDGHQVLAIEKQNGHYKVIVKKGK